MKKGISIVTAVSMTVLSALSFKSSSVTAEAKQPVEIVSLRSEYEKHFDNGDGSRTAYINTVPIHYLENGEWVEIDNSLVLDEVGNYVNIKNPLNVTFPSNIQLSTNESSDNSSVKLVNNRNAISISVDDLLFDCENLETKDEYIEATIIDSDNIQTDKNLPVEVINSFDNSISSVSYAFENKELVFDVRPNSLIEKIYLDEDWKSNDSLKTYIKADSITIKKDDEGNVDFIDIDDTIAFTMLSPTIVDSSLDQNSIPIKVDINESEKGYCFSFSIDEDIDDMKNLTYPLILSTEYSIQRSSNTRYNSEAYPYDNIYDQYIRIGNEENNAFQTFVSCSNPFLGLSEYTTITDATFNMYIIGNNLPSRKALSLYSLNAEPMNCCWNNASTINNSNTFITDFDVYNSDINSWKEISITRLVQSWFNYDNTSQNVGVAPYGFKMITTTDPEATIVAYSERASINQPYFEISYVVDDSYELKFEPAKYNNITVGPGNIYNFQNRMNCYAYALQVYYRGYLSSNEAYYLKPGEFGISEHNPTIQYLIDTNKVNYTYNFMNYAELEAKYSYYISLLSSDACSLNDFSSFIEEQMYKDAQALNFDIKKHSFNGSSFILPIDFDEDSERIIAMITYKKDNAYDYHFYLRNGNGTCQVHGGDCSIWSHKIANGSVKNTSHEMSYDLCDQNINYLAKMHSQSYNYYSNSDVNYYCISQDACVYNSYHTDGHVATSTGTPYYSY